jgi:manganese oxidase
VTAMTGLTLPLLGPLAWIDAVLLGWFALTAVSVAYVAWDAFVRGNPDVTVMKWGWLLVSLYMGPVALLLYVLAAKEPRPGTHAAFIRPLWKQGIGSTIHCVAGDATGIILAATVTAILGFPMWVDLGVEYAAGFAFGLFVFQALFMKDMMGGSYWGAVRMSFVPEWLSMNMMMAGMILVMVPLMMGRDMRAMEPSQLLYWGTMSFGIIAGFFTAYPVNLWLVAKGLKHGMMSTQQDADGSAQQGAHAGHAMAHAGGG